MKKIIVVFLLLNGLLLHAQQPAFITDSLDSYIQREMKRWQIPGLAIAIVKGDKVVATKGYANTLFMIASNSKAFTGTSLALLEKNGQLNLNDKVIDYLPYFAMHDPAITKMVTVEDVLSHRLGLETFQGDFVTWDSDLGRKKLIENFKNNIPVYDFRDTYGYCNMGFLVAGEVIHAVTDTTGMIMCNTIFSTLCKWNAAAQLKRHY